MPSEERDFQVGDRIVMNALADFRYTYTKEGARGVVVAVFNDDIAIEFDASTLSPGSEGHTPPFTQYTVSKDACQLLVTPMLNPFAAKIDSRQKYTSAVCEFLGVPADHPGVAPAPDDWVILRDNRRFQYKYWTKVDLPFGDSNFEPKEVDRLLHVAVNTPDGGTPMVAFFADDDKRQRDVTTRMKFGKYLAKFHPELDNEDIKKAVVKFEYLYGPAPELHKSEAEADFIQVIDEGPDSCMAGLDYEGHIHPAAVYASGDIEILWITDGERITARTIANKATKQTVRIYGDEAKMKPVLAAAGYTQAPGALVGCRILKIEVKSGSGHIMPYVDAGTASGGGCLYFESHDSKHWILCEEGNGGSTYCGYQYSGVTAPQEDEYECQCNDCGCGLGEEDINYFEDTGPYCDNCYADRTVVGYTGVRNGRAIQDTIWRDSAVFMEELDEYVHEDYVIEVMEHLGWMLDSYDDKWHSTDDMIFCICNDEYHYADNCKMAGTRGNETLYIHEPTKDDRYNAAHIYTNEDGDYFWHECDEIEEWDEAEEPGKYTLLSDTVKAESPADKVMSSIAAADAAERAQPEPTPSVTPLEGREGCMVAQRCGVRFEMRSLGRGQWYAWDYLEFTLPDIGYYRIDQSMSIAALTAAVAKAIKAGVVFEYAFGLIEEQYWTLASDQFGSYGSAETIASKLCAYGPQYVRIKGMTHTNMNDIQQQEAA